MDASPASPPPFTQLLSACFAYAFNLVCQLTWCALAAWKDRIMGCVKRRRGSTLPPPQFGLEAFPSCSSDLMADAVKKTAAAAKKADKSVAAARKALAKKEATAIKADAKAAAARIKAAAKAAAAAIKTTATAGKKRPRASSSGVVVHIHA